MTAQEALKDIIQSGIELGAGDYVDVEALKIAVKALKKQIPKKPDTENINRGIHVSGEYDIDSNYICPSCKSVVGDYESEDIWYKHCPECGQALDWSDDE